MSKEHTKYDDILWTMTKQTGGVAEFIGVIANFLQRRTDFFSGASDKAWETLLLKLFHEEKAKTFNENKIEETDESDIEEYREKSYSENNVPIVTYASNQNHTSGDDGDDDDDDDGAGDDDGEEELSKSIQIADDETENDEVGKLIPNPGNGCTLPNYSWTQTLKEIELKVPLDSVHPLRSRDLNVNIGKRSLTVGIKGQSPIINDELHEEIRPDESTWMLQDGRIIFITLEKRKKSNWWDRLVMSDPVIALRKIKPEDSKLSDLDDSTRITVEKMLYNQRQKQLGLPTSEDQEKMKILKNFKKTHPELDFSQCKF